MVHLSNEGAMQGFPYKSHLGLGSAWPVLSLAWVLAPAPCVLSTHTSDGGTTGRERVSFATPWRAFFLFNGCSSFVLKAGVDNEIANERLASPAVLSNTPSNRRGEEDRCQDQIEMLICFKVLCYLSASPRSQPKYILPRHILTRGP